VGVPDGVSKKMPLDGIRARHAHRRKVMCPRYARPTAVDEPRRDPHVEHALVAASMT
jgi:hypothetical protein